MEEVDIDSLSDEEFLNHASPISSNPPTEDTTSSDVPAEEVVESPKEEQAPVSEDTTTDNVEDAVKDTLEFPDDFDYKAEYQKLCKPFKANGKTVSIRHADEIVSLMQKGIGYTAKSQKLQEQVRIATMLDTAGITKDDLNLLIEASKKNPKALQKLIKNSNIDPLDLDLSEESEEYVPSNYDITDEELQFKSTIEELNQTPVGKELLTTVKDWDAPSKDVIWKQPNLLNILAEQVESGVYKTISDEVDRRKLVGTIPNTTPFLQAYHEVGQQLLQNKSKAKATNPPVATVNSNKSNRVIVDRRVTTPKSNLPNSDKVSAASIANKPSKQGGNLVNPLALSDEEFLKLTVPY